MTKQNKMPTPQEGFNNIKNLADKIDKTIEDNQYGIEESKSSTEKWGLLEECENTVRKLKFELRKLYTQIKKLPNYKTSLNKEDREILESLYEEYKPAPVFCNIL